MRISIQIGSAPERDISEASEGWINQQISRQRQGGKSLCVRVRLEGDGINITLSTPGCPSLGVGGRQANVDEQKFFELWEKRGLKDAGFSGGNLIAFLKQISSAL